MEFQPFGVLATFPLRKFHQLAGRRIGNSHLMLQVRYCVAALERCRLSDNLLGGPPPSQGADHVMRIMMKSKIHRATVTQADLDYVGSVTLDAALMEAADLLEGEQV